MLSLQDQQSKALKRMGQEGAPPQPHPAERPVAHFNKSISQSAKLFVENLLAPNGWCGSA